MIGKQVRIVLILVIVCLVIGGSVSYFAAYTQPMIERNAREALKKAVNEVLPGVDSFEEIVPGDSFRVYKGKDAGGNTIGYAIYRVGVGFQDKIALIFGVDPDMTKIFALNILDQKETPGLGAKITDDKAFLGFWKEKSLTSPISYAKPPRPADALSDSQINAISGATISSDAVVKIVNAAVEEARGRIGGES
ncbi:MAG TPA: FMN-binding protein [Thermoanaerobaculia bacterium]|nr:FMN-binding protein [Thermoanaerobaculia bacterium]HUM28978.1 FMN-binding protein [Thermoanaerobaculia bacterium]HXK67090.1 FMN-binding protein [Thermoanaerobaculia bacterium]